MTAQADAELVALARGGHKAAFGWLIERHRPVALRVAFKMVGQEELAQDLVQEAILQAYLCLDHLRDDARFRSWLYGIVLNVCRNHIRARRIDFFALEALEGGRQFEAIPLVSPSPEPQAVAEMRELHQRILAAVETLSPKNRAATLLFYYEELSLHEIAALLGVSVVAIKGRLHKARQQLRAQLAPVSPHQPYDRPTKRRCDMIEMRVADVVKLTHPSSLEAEPAVHDIVVLVDQEGQRALPIWVGPWEGDAIRMALREIPLPRPLTFTFLTRLLEASGAQVEQVRIESLKDETFYATVTLRQGESSQEVDARPSDALALALRTSAPIYVTTPVMEAAGIALPGAPHPLPTWGRGLDQWQQQVSEKMQAMMTAIRSRSTEEKRSLDQALLALLVGAEPPAQGEGE